MKYERIPQVVEAVQFWPWARHDAREVAVSGDPHSLAGQTVRWEFDLPTGTVEIKPGDWIVTDGADLRGVLDEHEFARHYRPLAESAEFETNQRPRRFRWPIEPSPHSPAAPLWQYGVYFPTTDLQVLDTERIGEGWPVHAKLEWLD